MELLLKQILGFSYKMIFFKKIGVPRTPVIVK